MPKLSQRKRKIKVGSPFIVRSSQTASAYLLFSITFHGADEEMQHEDTVKINDQVDLYQEYSDFVNSVQSAKLSFPVLSCEAFKEDMRAYDWTKGFTTSSWTKEHGAAEHTWRKRVAHAERGQSDSPFKVEDLGKFVRHIR